MLRTIPAVACLSLTLALVACNSAGPTAPIHVTRHVTGTVRDERGKPIAGASIHGGSGLAVLSDEAGQFGLEMTAGSTNIVATKAGYELDTQNVSGTTRDFTLHDIIRLSVGESVRVTIGPNDPLGELPAIDEVFRFRVIRVTAGMATRADVRLVREDGSSPSSDDGKLWLRPYSFCCLPVLQAFADIAAGGEVEVQIHISDSNWGRPFTLITSRLAP